MDWMYQGGLAAKEDAAKRADEHLLGKAANLPLSAEAKKEEASRVSGTKRGCGRSGEEAERHGSERKNVCIL